ncbi:MAG: cyclase family protein [Pseudomonadota bacterium]
MQCLVMVVLLLASSAALAGDYLPDKWWPSPWGADDQKGALNHLNAAKVMQATQHITAGKVYDLGQVFEEEMPLFLLTPKPRKYTLSVPGAPTWGPLGKNQLLWNDDYISGHLSQDGTQFDALAHMGTQLGKPGDLNEIRYYNGHSHAEIGTSRGFTKLGVENVDPIFTNGLLLDFEALRGRALECSEELSVEDIKAALAKQGLDETSITTGTALLYNTGWSKYWMTDNDKFHRCAPGLSDAAGDWVVDKNVLLVGTDNWAVEAIPGSDPDLFAPNHQKFLIENGIYIIENMRLDSLIADQVFEFAFIVTPLPLKGATGSPVRPMAVK